MTKERPPVIRGTAPRSVRETRDGSVLPLDEDLTTLDGIADGTLTAVPQPAEGVSLAPKVTTADARADFTTPAAALDRLIRSVTPEPGAWCGFRDDRLGLGPVRPLRTGEVELAPGELRVERRRVLAGTATVPVELGEVKPKGKRFMPAPDWARGARIDGVEYLG